MTDIPVFFWQNMPAHHQTGALDAFASSWGAPATGVWCEDISPIRKAQGWSPASRVRLRNCYLPLKGWEDAVDDLIDVNQDSIHIFSGIGAYPPVTRAARRLAGYSSPKMGVIVESSIMLGWAGFARRLKAHVCYRGFVDKLSAVFAMGNIGMDFYRGIGFKDEQLYPYLYQESVPLPSARPPGRGVMRMLYAGQLNDRKGVDVLIEACRLICAPGWSLDIFGDGPLRNRLKQAVISGGIEGQVSFRGTVPSASLLAEMPSFDVAVVPSRFDGWGMLVNEALQSGLAVLASDKVGASILVSSSGAGAIFPKENPKALADAIRIRVLNPELLSAEQASALEYAPRLSPERAGEYLASAIRYAFQGQANRPAPGWIV